MPHTTFRGRRDRMARRIVWSLLCSVASGTAYAADPLLSFSAGSHSQADLGDQIGSGLDIFSVTGNSATGLDIAKPTAVAIGTYAFTVGVNCVTCALTPSFVAPIPLSVAGYGTQSIEIPYTWSSIKTADFLTVATIEPLVFGNSSGPVFDVVFEPLPVLTSSTSAVVSGSLVATVSAVSAVPEPGTTAMMLAGMTLLALVVSRRRKPLS